jgi:mannose-6-phosphate isomerase-like protein (cupin superfamily)
MRRPANPEGPMRPDALPTIVGPAEIVLPCADLSAALAFFVGELGFRVETIFPAEEPSVASLSGHGMRLRLVPGGGDPGRLRLACTLAGQPPRTLTSPNGTVVELVEADPPLDIPELKPEFILTRQSDAPDMGAGRAGMLYRDLIPGRLGGRFIASHIAIPEGGPVSDWVHFHKIRFQMIFCRRGWVQVVYEDQGEPFRLEAGDCVLQPPQIRHRVLEASPGLEVVEIGCPALHETLADHDLTLPTGRNLPDRDFGGQVFLRHVAANVPWAAIGDTGFEQRRTEMARATRGIADVRVIRPGSATALGVAPHSGELMFAFVLEGSATLERSGEYPLGPCDAFVIPAGEAWGLSSCSADFQLLQVALPAE